MEEEICQHHKFGFCRYKDECNKKHFNTECKDLGDCKSTKTCHKRHPKKCKRYDIGNCRFEDGCAYKHHMPTQNTDHAQFKEKLEQMEKVLHAMTRKVLSLETDMKDMKINHHKTVEELKKQLSECLKEQNGVADENCTFNQNDIENATSTPKAKKSQIKTPDIKADMHKCKECNYTCKKEKSLKSHILTKHEVHQCKECGDNLPNFMQLLKHVANHKAKDQVDGQDKIPELKTGLDSDIMKIKN